MNPCYLHLLLAFATVATAISAAYEDDVGASIDIIYEGAQSIATEDTRTLAGNNWEENDDEEGNDNNKIHRATGWVENIISDEFPTADADGNNIKRGGHKKFTVFHLLDNKDNKGLAEGYADKFLSLYSVTEKSAMLLNANNDAFFSEDFATGSLISLEYLIPSAYAADTNKNERRSFQHERYDTKNAFQVVSYDILYDARDRDNEDDAGNAQKARGVGKRGEYSLGTLYVSHRRLLVIIGNFKGYDPISCTVDDLHNTVFGMDENSVVSYFHNRTNGIYDFTRDARGNGNKDVVGPYTIQIDKSRGCDSGTWASDLIEAARNDGVNVEYYQHRMLIIPKTELCSWDGLGTVGCSLSCNTWIPHCANSKVMEHELGHNLGLDHEGSLLNEINSFVEYGDPTGIMGNKWWSSDGADDIVAPHMVQLGAIWGALTVSAAGTYEISPLDIRPESAEHSQTMRVRSSVNGRYYYFSYRVGQNFNLGHKILVQRFRSTYYPTEFIGSFDVGETFMDVNDVFGVRVVSITNASAVLEVTFGCTKAPPALELFVRNPAWKGDSNFGRIGLTDPAAPVQMWWNNKRKVWTTSVVVRVTDNNSPNCFETQYVLGTEFNVSGASGSGLVVAYDAKSATIRSGTSCDLAVTFETKTKGAYPMVITATGRDAAVNVTLNLNAPESCVRQLHVVVPVRQNTSEDDNADADGAKYAEYPRAKRVVNVSHFYDYYDGPLTMSFTVVNTNPSSCGEGDGAFTFATAEFDDDIFRGDDSDDSDYESDEFYNNSNCCGDLFSIEGAFSHSGSKSWSSTMLTVTATLNNNSLSNIGTTCTAYAKVCNKKDSALCTGLMLNLHLVEGCYRTMPKISIGRFTYISARSSIGIPVIIEDGAEKPRSCKYTLSIVDKDVPSSVTSSVLDPVIVTKKSIATTRVVFNGRDELGAHEDITSLIAIQEFEGKTGPNVTFVTEEAVCVKGAPRVSYSCSNTLVDEGAKEVKFYCHVYISNTDSWFCKNTTFMINRVEDPRLNITYERESVNVFPGDTESIDIDFLYNASDEIEETAFKFDFEINDTEGLELHGKKDTVIKEIGPCVYDNPTIEIGDDDSQSGFNEREYKYIARITNNNNMFCKSVSFKVTLNSSSFENISFSYPTSIVISSLETREITIVASPKGEISNTYNFSLYVKSNKNDTYNSESDYMELTTFGGCQHKAPTLELVSNTSTLPVGEGECFLLNGTLRNNDVGCPKSTFQFSGTVSYGFSGRIYATKFTLEPNETRPFTAHFWSRENTPSGTHTVQISVAEDSIPVHSVTTNSPITVNCSERPEAPHSFTFTQDTPLFSPKTRITLSWKSCESDVFCCGPCTWKIYRNGKYAGTSKSQTFTDYSPATKGETYSYRVVTYDSRGVASADDSCKNIADVVGESADMTNFLVLIIGIVIVVVAIIVAVVTIVVVFNRDKIRKQIKVLRTRFDSNNDDPVLEVELLDEAPKI